MELGVMEKAPIAATPVEAILHGDAARTTPIPEGEEGVAPATTNVSGDGVALAATILEGNQAAPPAAAILEAQAVSELANEGPPTATLGSREGRAGQSYDLQVLELVDAINAPSTAGDGEVLVSEVTSDDQQDMLFEVGKRVTVRQASGEEISGMVAELNGAMLLVAADDGSWMHLPVGHGEGSSVALETKTPAPGMGVVAFMYDNSNSNVAGMLLGEKSELVLGGKANAYLAHVTRPRERDKRLRARVALDDDNVFPSYSLGDIVHQAVQPVASAQCAVIVRVAYSRRHQNQQARRLLILLDLDMKVSALTLPVQLPEASLKTFFPGGWAKWKQLVLPQSCANEVKLTQAKIRELEKVQHCVNHG